MTAFAQFMFQKRKLSNKLNCESNTFYRSSVTLARVNPETRSVARSSLKFYKLQAMLGNQTQKVGSARVSRLGQDYYSPRVTDER